MRRRILAKLARDTRGGISIASALAMTMLIGSAALAVDFGSLYLDRRKLLAGRGNARTPAEPDPDDGDL